MATALKVYSNEDDALLFWNMTHPIAGCRGFAIERKITRKGANAETQDVLQNRVGFAGQPVPANSKGHGISKPSTEWPFQRFSWTDHDVNTGDTVSYRIVPMIGKAGNLQKNVAEASAFSDPVTLGALPKNAKYRPFFNRGFVMSQFMSRYLSENNLSLAAFKKQIGTAAGKQHENRIRAFLSGDLRIALLDLLKNAKAAGVEIFAALFELSDPELVAGLVALGPKAHVVLANGSIQKKKTETSAEARQRDENKTARAQLRKARVDVATSDRFISPGALGHNKFVVVLGKNGKPTTVWTGSTNWQPTGLCTQVNNGLLIDDPAVADIYLAQWKRLKAAKSGFPDALVQANSAGHKAGNATVWFSRSAKQIDLDALNAEVANAKEGVLFLMFMPGAAGVFGTVMKRSAEPHLFVRGVVSELPRGRNDESEAEVHLVSGQDNKPLHLDIIQPEGVQNPMAQFAAEVTRKQFLGQVGHAIIHSKVLVIDPFSDSPVVITGSHNFSISASSKNDENFIIIRGDKALAEAYAVNVEGAYQHYRWRALLQQTDNKPFDGLRDDDQWQAPKLKAAQQELNFWGVTLAVV